MFQNRCAKLGVLCPILLETIVPRQTKQLADKALKGSPVIGRSKSVLFGSNNKVSDIPQQLDGSIRHSGHGLGDFPDPDAAPGPRSSIKKSLSASTVGQMARTGSDTSSSQEAREPTSVTFHSSSANGASGTKHAFDKQGSARGRGLTVIAQTAGFTSGTTLGGEPHAPEHITERMEERLLTVSVCSR